MPRGSAFQPTQTPDLVQRAVQRDLKDTLDQLDDHRQGMLISDVRALTDNAELGEDLIVIYSGPAGKKLKLPKASLRGTGRGQVLVIANQGSGSVTLVPSGGDTFGGIALLPISGTAVLWSDGATKWHEVSGQPGSGLAAGLIGGSGIASITLDAQGRVTAAVATAFALASRLVSAGAGLSGGGDLTADRTISMPNTGPGAGTIGSHSAIPVSVTLDIQGRVTAVTTQSTAVTLSNDLDVRRPRATQGTALVAGDFALSAGWGSTASISNVLTGSKDSRGEFAVTANGAGIAANPTITLTWKNGAWPSSPFAIVHRNGGTGANTEPTWVAGATTLVMTFPATPVAGLTYTFAFMVLG